MKVVLTQNSPLGRVNYSKMKVELTQNTAVGKVNFSKVSRTAQSLDDLTDVIISNPQDNDNIVYDETLNQFVNKPLSIDSGTF